MTTDLVNGRARAVKISAGAIGAHGVDAALNVAADSSREREHANAAIAKESVKCHVLAIRIHAKVMTD